MDPDGSGIICMFGFGSKIKILIHFWIRIQIPIQVKFFRQLPLHSIKYRKNRLNNCRLFFKQNLDDLEPQGQSLVKSSQRFLKHTGNESGSEINVKAERDPKIIKSDLQH